MSARAVGVTVPCRMADVELGWQCLGALSRRSVWAAEQGCEHFLEAGDEVVSFPRTLGQVLDLVVLDRKFPA